MAKFRPLALALAAVALAPALAAQSATSATDAVPSPVYQRLAPGDLVAVSVYQAPELDTVARLDASGALTMPAAGRVVLQGESAAAAGRTIATRLQATYLRHPQVTLVVRAFAAAPVTVMGAVKSPGVYSARSYPDLTAVLAAAGGATTPSGAQVLVTSRLGKVTALSLSQLEREPGAANNLALHAGDVVRVVPSATVYVAGDVLKPGAFPMPASGLTLIEAVALAGGLGPDAAAARARLIHTQAPNAASTPIDLTAVAAGRAPDAPLGPFDLLYIPHSTAHAVSVAALRTVVNVAATIAAGVVVFR